jgi:hypothetical protein
VLLDDALDILLGLGGDGTLGDLLEQSLLGAREMLTELALPTNNLLNRDRIELQDMSESGCHEEHRPTHQTVDTGVDDRDLDLGRKRLVLALLQELGETGTTRKQETSRRVEIGTKLGKRRDFTVLREIELERASKLLHDLTACQI